MANEHIEALRKIGLGKESVAGTAVAASAWIPKEAGGVEPEFKAAVDKSSFGSIFIHNDAYTTMHGSTAKLAGIFRDTFGGHLLMATLGTTQPCLKMVMVGSGSFTVGETINQATSLAVGVVQRVEGSAGAQTVLASITSGTFDNSHTITGASSGATGICATLDLNLRTHLFTLLNSNAHPTYTIWESNPVGAEKAAYGMLDKISFKIGVDSLLGFDSEWKAIKPVADTCTPAFSASENAFVAKHLTVKLATGLSGLAAASAIDVQSISFTVQKGVKQHQKFGSIDIAGQVNSGFVVTGEMTAVFNATTWRDYVANSNKKAMRIDAVNTDVTIGSAGNPSLRFDFAKVSFTNWGRAGGSDDLVTQKIAFEALLSVTDAEGMVATLQNTRTTTY